MQDFDDDDWYGDAYHNPSKLGLRIVGTADAGMGYEYDLFVVWTDQAGQLYYAQDAGCSCPSPFEDYKTLESLTKATPAELDAALIKWGLSNANDVLTTVMDLRERIANR